MTKAAHHHGPFGSEAVTEGIRVVVRPSYDPDRSDAAKPEHVFLYKIRITNEGPQPAQLLARRWLIVDAQSRRNQVEGEGVVGRQPRIEPGQTFEYESWCPLRTAWGTMEGAFTMRRDDGERFDVTVARFYLAVSDSAPAR